MTQKIKLSSSNAKFSNGEVAFSYPEIQFELGSIYTINGQNGSGKTTFLKSISEIILEKLDGFYLDQNFTELIYDYHSIWWNIMLPKIIRLKKSRSYWIAEAQRQLALYGFELNVRRLAGEMSGGEKHFVTTLRMMNAEPEIAFLDEPVSGLDPGTAASLWQLVTELRSAGITVIVVSHEVPSFGYGLEQMRFSGVNGRNIVISKVD